MKRQTVIFFGALACGAMLGAGVVTTSPDRPQGYEHWVPANKIKWLEGEVDRLRAENKRIMAMLSPEQKTAATAPRPEIPYVGMTMAQLRAWAGPKADISLVSQSENHTSYRCLDWDVTFNSDGKISYLHLRSE